MSSDVDTFARVAGDKEYVSRQECIAVRLLHHQYGMSGRKIAGWLERQDKCIHRHMNGRCQHGELTHFGGDDGD